MPTAAFHVFQKVRSQARIKRRHIHFVQYLILKGFFRQIVRCDDSLQPLRRFYIFSVLCYPFEVCRGRTTSEGP
jgi:hypothetical protein